MSAYMPLFITAALVLYIAWTVGVRIRTDRRHVPSPQDGCCGCGAAECDVVVALDERGRGEGYCWPCIETWPAEGTPVDQLGVRVFAGREGGAR